MIIGFTGSCYIDKFIDAVNEYHLHTGMKYHHGLQCDSLISLCVQSEEQSLPVISVYHNDSDVKRDETSDYALPFFISESIYHWLPIPISISEMRQYRYKQDTFTIGWVGDSLMKYAVESALGVEVCYISSNDENRFHKLGKCDTIITNFDGALDEMSLYGMAMGIPILAGASQQLCKMYRKHIGDYLPFVWCSLGSVSDAVSMLKSDSEFYQTSVENGYVYLNHYHSLARVGERCSRVSNLARQRYEQRLLQDSTCGTTD